MNCFIIDCNTKGKSEGIARLEKLKSTIEVSDGGVYREDEHYSQIWITTVWTEAQLDKWLYSRKFRNFDPIGVAVID